MERVDRRPETNSLSPVSQVEKPKSDSNMLLSIITAIFQFIASLFSGKSKSSDLTKDREVKDETASAPSKERNFFQLKVSTPASKNAAVTTPEPTVDVIKEAKRIKTKIERTTLPKLKKTKQSMPQKELNEYFDWIKNMIKWSQGLNKKNETKVGEIIKNPLEQLFKELTRLEQASKVDAIRQQLESYLLLAKFTPEKCAEISNYIEEARSYINGLNLNRLKMKKIQEDLNPSISLLLYRLNNPE